MIEILMAIKPEFADKILSGSKTFEYRKRVPKQEFDLILFYVSSPIMKVLFQSKIKRILDASPDEVWNETKEKGCVDFDFFYQYFNNKQTAYAIELCDVKQFKVPKSLSEFGVLKPPQNFMYLHKKSSM